MKKVILISAKAQHGKDTFASFLKQELEKNGERVLITHFARFIKSMLVDYYGAETEDGTYNTIVKNDTVRTKLQQLGTEVIRQELKMPMFHVKRICEDIDIVKDDFDYVIIPDCRFHNEVDFTKAYFPRQVEAIRLVRQGFESTLSEEQKNHVSEIDLDDYRGFDRRLHSSGMTFLKEYATHYATKLKEDK